MEEEGASDWRSLNVSRRCSDLSFLACIEFLISHLGQMDTNIRTNHVRLETFSLL